MLIINIEPPMPISHFRNISHIIDCNNIIKL